MRRGAPRLIIEDEVIDEVGRVLKSEYDTSAMGDCLVAGNEVPSNHRGAAVVEADAASVLTGVVDDDIADDLRGSFGMDKDAAPSIASGAPALVVPADHVVGDQRRARQKE